MSYYKTIDGKKYDGKLIDLAEKAIEGAKDNRISKEDAAVLLDAIKDGRIYSVKEKSTMAYIRKNFNWTEASDLWFRTEVRKWAASKRKTRSN
jgi:putative lipase involved disintegration of autophagic bodies